MNILSGIGGGIKTAFETIKSGIEMLPDEIKAIALIGLAAAVLYAVLGR